MYTYMYNVVGYSLGAGIADTLANNIKQVRNVRMYNSPTTISPP